ncbi:FAD-binding protein, partial [Streptomyces rimosus]|uniref:FAD-binding protein n=1 Tax=Streptomyces rimosus TaxID=1927 RepID=UPI001F519BBC
MSSPDPAPTEPDLAEQLVRLTRRMHRAQQRHMEDLDIALTPAQTRLLRIVDHYRDQAPRMADLAARLEVGPRAVTTLVDALEAKDAVRRVPDPANRRVVRIELTDTGRSTLRALRGARRDAARDILAPLTAEEREVLGGLCPPSSTGRPPAAETLARVAAPDAGPAARASRADRRYVVMPLLEPKPEALRPAAAEGPYHDRVTDRQASGTPERLRDDLVALLGPDKVLHHVSDLVRYASDASPYRFVPQVVVLAEDIDDVSAVFSYAHGKGRSVVFRAAGTSLNGQAQGEDILVDVRRHWAGVEVLDGGARARIRPGTTVVRANAALARHGRLLGPDPASAIACTLGGVVANNASGMTAGTTRNSYRTLASVTLVLPSGTIVDTGDPAADEELAHAEPELCRGLLALKAEIEADPELVARIRAKYEIKNTNGYRLDAFLDGTTPAEILRGLAVGSEGTL